MHVVLGKSPGEPVSRDLFSLVQAHLKLVFGRESHHVRHWAPDRSVRRAQHEPTALLLREKFATRAQLSDPRPLGSDQRPRVVLDQPPTVPLHQAEHVLLEIRNSPVVRVGRVVRLRGRNQRRHVLGAAFFFFERQGNKAKSRRVGG